MLSVLYILVWSKISKYVVVAVCIFECSPLICIMKLSAVLMWQFWRLTRHVCVHTAEAVTWRRCCIDEEWKLCYANHNKVTNYTSKHYYDALLLVIIGPPLSVKCLCSL